MAAKNIATMRLIAPPKKHSKLSQDVSHDCNTKVGSPKLPAHFHPGSMNTRETPQVMPLKIPLDNLHLRTSKIPLNTTSLRVSLKSPKPPISPTVILNNGNTVNLVSKRRTVYAIRLLRPTTHDFQIEVEMLKSAISKGPMLTSSCIYFSADIQSPFPLFSYSPRDKSINKVRLQSVLEELFQTERTYIVSLQLFHNNYVLLLLQLSGREVPIPIIWINTYLEELSSHHSKFLKLGEEVVMTSNSMNELVQKVSHLLGNFAINVNLYTEYCNLSSDVLRLVDNGTNNFTLNTIWIKGWETYLEATQPADSRMDLSFMSLIQKPISRIGKYRLILESLMKYSDDQSIEIHLKKMKRDLERVNNFAQIENKLNTFLKNGFNTSSYGKALLIGSINVVWIEESCKSCSCGAFLFKSHIVFLDLKTKRYETVFVLPLSKVQIQEIDQFEGGLFSNYPFLIKLLFEDIDSHYEVLLVFLTNDEYRVWQDYLTTLINFVNGPCKMKFEVDEIKYLFKCPERLNRYDICLRQSKHKDTCYFRELKPITIQANFFVFSCNQSNLFLSTNSHRDEEIIVLKKSERSYAELILKDIWSKEIPVIFEEKVTPVVRKSSSWSAMRRGALKSIRYSNSGGSYFNGRTFAASGEIRNDDQSRPDVISSSNKILTTPVKSLSVESFRDETMTDSEESKEPRVNDIISPTKMQDSAIELTLVSTIAKAIAQTTTSLSPAISPVNLKLYPPLPTLPSLHSKFKFWKVHTK